MAKLRKDVVAVVHQIHATEPHEHNTRLFIGDVPSEVGEHEIKDALTAAGRWFGEFKVAWANHYLVRLPEADPQVRGAWRRNEAAEADGGEGEVSYVSWTDLIEETDETEVLFLRVPTRLKSALAQKAHTEKLSINEYCARVLASAAQTSPLLEIVSQRIRRMSESSGREALPKGLQLFDPQSRISSLIWGDAPKRKRGS